MNLPTKPVDGSTIEYADLYGVRQDEWIYCWKCDMPLTLEEISGPPHSSYTDAATYPPFDAGRGFYHQHCPRRGSRPTMPNHLKRRREENLQRKGGTR